MFVKLRINTLLYKADRLSALRHLLQVATAAAALDFIGEEIGEQLTGILPVVAVDAIPHLRRLDGALDETRVLEFPKVLAHCGLGDGQLFVDVTEVAFLPSGQELQNLNPRRMGEGFGKARYLFRLEALVFLFVHWFSFSLYRSQIYE